MILPVEHETLAPHFEKLHLRPPEWPLPQPFVFHRLTAPDMGDPHDHPMSFTSHVLTGGYVEEVYAADGSIERIERLPGTAHHVEAAHIHRIVGLPAGECITLCLYGPHERETRFWRWDAGGAWSRQWDSMEWVR